MSREMVAGSAKIFQMLGLGNRLSSSLKAPQTRVKYAVKGQGRSKGQGMHGRPPSWPQAAPKSCCPISKGLGGMETERQEEAREQAIGRS